MLVPLTVQCVVDAAAAYHLPQAPLWAILRVEGGHIGQAVRNTNGSLDFGPFQVNSSWVPAFRVYWKLPSNAVTVAQLRDNGCWNAYAAAAILRVYVDQSHDLGVAIGWYNSHTPYFSQQYRQKVARALATLYPRRP